MCELLSDIFKIPQVAFPFIPLFMTNEEILAVEIMEHGIYSFNELSTLLQLVSYNPQKLIASAYSRAVFNKIDQNGSTLYQVADFFKRLAFFAQFEPDKWQEVPSKARKEIDNWYVYRYAESSKERLELSLKGEHKLIESAYFITLDEATDLVDKFDFDLYMVPCNCKSVAMNCNKPRNVCISFKKGINSKWDRGHGIALTKNEAKDILKYANKNGLIQTSEEDSGICNCDACCCYPLRASKLIGAKGIWPKARYSINWDEDKCINCGKCVYACNFGAFQKQNAKIVFYNNLCWGCTVCKFNCPTGAISLKKLKM